MLLKRGVSVQNFQASGNNLFTSSAFASEISPLSQVSSKMEGSRAAYQDRNILERYYRDNSTVEHHLFVADI